MLMLIAAELYYVLDSTELYVWHKSLPGWSPREENSLLMVKDLLVVCDRVSLTFSLTHTQTINWGARDAWSSAPKPMSCN